MVGSALDDEALDAVAAAVSVLDADDDIEASAAHRRRVAPVLARRALRDAARRASEEETA
jgi:CO/xanthine dehydrogenase FAD-binding subunit